MENNLQNLINAIIEKYNKKSSFTYSIRKSEQKEINVIYTTLDLSYTVKIGNYPEYKTYRTFCFITYPETNESKMLFGNDNGHNDFIIKNRKTGAILYNVIGFDGPLTKIMDELIEKGIAFDLYENMSKKITKLNHSNYRQMKSGKWAC